MPWVVGIDEAGYGPNLGPLVQAAVALHLPDSDSAGWKTLRPVVRRCRGKDDGRLLIDDSKKVYTRHGIEALELAVQAALLLMEPTVGDVLRRSTLPACREELCAEGWHDPTEAAPVAADAATIRAAFNALTD